MPLFTDSLLLGEVVRRVAERLGDRVLFAPLQWLGNSDHHLDFPGTLSAAPRVYLDLLNDLLENFLAHGFRRLVFVNGHGGNIVPGQQAVFEVRQRHRAARRPAAAVRHLLAARRPSRTRPTRPRAGADGPRLRVGDVDDAAARPAPGRRPVGGRAGRRSATPFEPAPRGWITQDRSEPGPHRRPAAGHRREGRGAVPDVRRRRGAACSNA